ncbi:unnamed protein product, partial [Ixodes pacificus]
LHHDQRYFPDPEVFDPGRFLGDNRKLIQPFTYLPFGEGPRQCVGMKFALFKVKFCLFHVLSKISFQVGTETDVSYHFDTIFSVSNRFFDYYEAYHFSL